MAPKKRKDEPGYDETLHLLHVQLVKLQRHVIASGMKVLLLLEGRDAAGKDGVIKRIIRHLSPRETRVFAPTKPSDRDAGTWYFQRFVPHLPMDGEIVIFNRSWYNRAGVERVMGFCTEEQVARFMRQAPTFERLLVEAGVVLVKLYLDITREEQAKRLDKRRHDPLKQWKISAVDARAIELWDAYSDARDEMLRRTHSEHAPWTIVNASEKRPARLELIRFVLSRIDYPERDDALVRYDPARVFGFEESAAVEERLSS
jgi:polyphosphate kinase 2